MFVTLRHRHYGVHKFIKEIEIPCNFDEVYLGEDNINEQLLLDNIPKGWLRDKPNQILLMVEDELGNGTGQHNLKIFRNWSKYYDCYSLTISKSPC